jgi:polyribonucleotide nucleotidyltransferase
MFDIKTKTITVGKQEIKIQTGKLARQAKSSVEISCGKTNLLVTIAASDEPRKDADFFPLMVDFEEKIYSVGRIPGSYNRREGRASDKAVLSSRLIDRPVRPLFPGNYRHEVGINILTLSVDPAVQPDILGMIGVGFALELSGLPAIDAFAGVRIGTDADGEFIVNPSEEETDNSDLDIVVAATASSIMMVEAGANFLPDNKVVEAIAFAHSEVQNIVNEIKAFAQECGVTKVEYAAPDSSEKLKQLIADNATEDLKKSMQNATKASRKEHVANAKAKVEVALDSLSEDDELHEYLVDHPFDKANEIKALEKKLLRAQIKDTGVRADGRKNDQVRPLFIETGKYPVVHGDALFTRGDTQVLSLLTLGTERDARSLDGIDNVTEKRYMHNYNFPAWSVGEVRPNRGPGRREIGHGALGERAVMPSLPSQEDFPYAIRIVSEILSSSGSTSMAATCASSLALMEGGVPVKAPVAGVAMGLMIDEEKTVVLTDIHELEDFLGDMDFKVAGNQSGISALQMDIKVQGISVEVISTAIEQAKAGRLHILNAMLDVISEPKSNLKPNAPQIVSMKIDPEKIGAVIGPSGKNIKWITEATGTEVNINDDGMVNIYCTDVDAADQAKRLISATANGVKQGEVWEGTIVKVLENVGAIAELLPGISGLIHISQIAHERVNNVEEHLKVDDKVKVLVQGQDFKGRISLSRKALLDKDNKENLELAATAGAKD